MPAAYTTHALRDIKAQKKLEVWNDANTENGHCPPLLPPTIPFVPVAEIRNRGQFDVMMTENRRREEYAFSDTVLQTVRDHLHRIEPGLYEKILAPLFPFQRTAYTSLQYYLITGKVYNGRDSSKTRLSEDPNGVIPKGCQLPALVQSPTGAGKTRIIGAAALSRKTLIVVPTGGIRRGYREALERQYSALNVTVDFRILDPTSKRGNKRIVRKIDADSAFLQNECRLFVATYQALKEPTVLKTLISTYGKHSAIEQIIIDEGHHSAATTYRNIMKEAYAANPDLRVAYVTALLDRRDDQYLRHIRVYSMPLRWARSTSITADIRLNYLDVNFDGILIVDEDNEVRYQNVHNRKRKVPGDVKGKGPAHPSNDKMTGTETGTADFLPDMADAADEAILTRAKRASLLQQKAGNGQGPSRAYGASAGSVADMDLDTSSESGLLDDDFMDTDGVLHGEDEEGSESEYNDEDGNYDSGADSEDSGADSEDDGWEYEEDGGLDGEGAGDSDDDSMFALDDGDSSGGANNDDDAEEEAETHRMTEQQRLIAKKVPEDRGLQKYLIEQALNCQIRRATKSRTNIAMLLCCRDQDHAKWNRALLDEVMEDYFRQNENWRKVLKAELVVSKRAGMQVTPEDGYMGTQDGAHERIQAGYSNIIVQVFMYSEGVDVVPIKIVTFMCPRTKHIAYQMLGRGLRLFRFDDTEHNGRWFNTDPRKLKYGVVDWNAAVPEETVTVQHQFDLIYDNTLDIFVPECFDMRKDFEELDDSITCVPKPPPPEGLFISGGERSEKKPRKQFLELSYSSVDRTVLDMKGNAVGGISTEAVKVDLDDDYFRTHFENLREVGLDTSPEGLKGEERIAMMLNNLVSNITSTVKAVVKDVRSKSGDK